MKTKITLVVAASMFVFLMMSGSAFAAYPHGDFSLNPDACAACHRMHTATALNLIKDPTGGAMCETCHKNGQGADTDVMNGTYIAASTEANPSHVWGTDTGKLLGGGFDFISVATPTTSKHNVDGSNLTPPGTDTGAILTFKCTSCHTAHPDKAHLNQYRLLRAKPGDYAGPAIDISWNGPWTSAGQTATGGDYRNYTEEDLSATSPLVSKETTRNYNDKDLSLWCAACHTRYMADDTLAYESNRGGTSSKTVNNPYDAGDTYHATVNRFRHAVNVTIATADGLGYLDPVNGQRYQLKTDGPMLDLTGNGRTYDDLLTCLTCHKAHGSDAQMSGTAVLENRGAVLPSGTDSLLLRGDRGRRICADCHNM